MKLAAKGNDRLPRRLRLKVGIALVLSGAALGAHGAGLGRLSVLSSIGQPLRAEIELTSVAQDEGASLTARLASADTFKQASIDYGSALTGLRFSIQRRAGGQPYVLVTSTQLLNEPFLDVLVELSWSSGRLVREYTLLIDPPDAGTPIRASEPGPTIVQAQTPAPVIRARTPRAPAVASGDTAGSGTAVTTRAPATPGAASGTGAGGDYVVRSGDTAISIAREYKPANVSLEQMLAALYRDNSGAFNGNINRLNAGATMKIPDASAAQSVEAAQARRIIAQSSNFGSYRDRIARNAALAPTARDAGQQASGRLTTQIEDRAAPPSDAKDRLQLSRPDATRAASGSGARSGLGGASADELAAKDRELVETKTRLALLEKNVADLQKLLELKSQSLADLQKAPAGKAPDVASAVPSPAPSSIAAAPAPVAVAAPAPAPTPTTTTAGPATTPTSAPIPQPPVPAPVAAAPAPAPAPAVTKTTTTKSVAPAPEPSWYDSLMENSLLLAGLIAAVLLLIGYGLFTARRRRKLAGFEDSIFVDNSVLHANSVFGTTGGQSVDTANSGFHSNFVPVAGNLPEQNEVDPVAEADVYIAYGRDAQAEEILKEALRADATRPAVRLKLLEIYAKRGDAKMFETTASELYATTGGQGPDWAQAAALGLTIDPHNPLYSETAPVAVPAAAPTASQSLTSSTIGRTGAVTGSFPGRASSIDAGLAATGMGLSDFGVEPEPARTTSASATEYLKTDPLPRAEPNTATSAPSMDLDFDLGFTNTGIGPLTPDAPAPAPTAAPPDKNNGLDFDVGASTKPLIDPFTASAFGTGDASARTAVNLPAFRARAENDKTARPDGDGFSASDIFGSSIVADNDPEALYGETPKGPAPAPTPAPTPTPAQARTQDFRNVVDNHQFDKTEPLDAFSKINLDLDDGGYEATTLTPESSTRTDVWQAMATKLDLALAYSDIGDKDGARELLEEVVRNGDAAQAGRARTLIAELG